jgi:hypothetical protein
MERKMMRTHLLACLSLMVIACGGGDGNSLEARVDKAVDAVCACKDFDCQSTQIKALTPLADEWNKAGKKDEQLTKRLAKLDDCTSIPSSSAGAGSSAASGAGSDQSDEAIQERYEIGQLESKLLFNQREVCQQTSLEAAHREAQNMISRLESLESETPLSNDTFGATAGPYLDAAMACIERLQQQ